jgi:hypothetical protein
LLTQGTTFNIFVYIGAETGPPIIPFDKFFCLKAARMACHGMIMESVEEVVANTGGNVSTIFVIQHGIHNFPIQQHGLHRWKTWAIQCVGGSGENRVRGGVVGGQGVVKRIIKKSNKHVIWEEGDISIIGIHGMMIRSAR